MIVIIFECQMSVDCLLYVWLESEVMTELCNFLVVFLLPVNFYVDCESAPAYTTQSYWSSFFWVVLQFVWMKCFMEENFNQICKLAEGSLSLDGFYEELPLVFVVFFCLDKFSGVSDEESDHDSFFYQLFFLLNDRRVEGFHLVPEINLGYYVTHVELGTAEGTSAVFSQDCAFVQTVVTEDVRALSESDRFVVDIETDGTVMIFFDESASADTFLHI